jgi:RNA polymerase sigma factor (sigma-70 family)
MTDGFANDSQHHTDRFKAQSFAHTPWSLVLAAAGTSTPISQQALEQLCRAYWPPVFAHLRMKGYALHHAQDLTQEFFSRLLSGKGFAGVAPEKGRFRNFLLASLKHFLINEWKRERTQKRGGGVSFVELNDMDSNMLSAYESHSGENQEQAYDKRWALTLLTRARARMRTEYEAADQLDRHEALKGYLADGEEPSSYAETAEKLCISEAAVKSAIYKIRQRFGQIIRAEIARTVPSDEDVEDELRYLISVLRD